MLVGNIQDSIVTQSYPNVVKDILDYLEQTDLSALALGRHELPQFDSQQAWFVILEYEKEPLENFKPEVHKHHSDLQIVLEGSENMAWSIDTGEHINAQEYLVERDLQFYNSEGIDLNLMSAKPGQFYLFTPDIVHVTNIDDGVEGKVRKLVVKIHNDLLVE